MTAALPDLLRNGGNILFRQTTFWDVESRDARRWRVRFVHKVEFSFVEPNFAHAAVVTEHPILIDHQEPIDSLFISSRAGDPEGVLLELESLTESHFLNWRSLTRYLNSAYPPLQLLFEGSGMLLRAPRSFADACAAVLHRHGVRVEVLRGGPLATIPLEALVLGRNFVVSERLVFEEL